MKPTHHKTLRLPASGDFLGCSYRWIVGMLLLLTAAGCFASNLSPVSHIAPPANQLPPSELTETEPTPVATREATTASAKSDLLAPPLPQDLPLVPLSRE